MLYFLLLLSFLLHVFTFILIKTLRDKWKVVQVIEETQAKNKEELENLLTFYLMEIKEENEKLNQILNEKIKTKPEQTKQAESFPDQGKEQQTTSTKTPYPSQKKPNYVNETNSYVPPFELVNEDTLEQSPSAKVFSLYDQGESVEKIARKLGLGKTEVELMLKFHRKNS
ncbi:DUF6115 domain-containing protein [Aquibacillus salsiterrae]|uniref:Uncharacterized protein n=1 Tax=Aquibacillus salsiterrae TaxID=2950439 RepID=A0A9X3WFA8_9BACI|nr:hypothetical protein [Aquibacillus salsiterrae]MDC3416374.1 hypothetical protein [Aquibacillus salsiterrae]